MKQPRRAVHRALPRDAALEQVVQAAIAGPLAQISANAPGLAGPDSEGYLHQLRIGMRRLRAALRIFRPIVTRKARKSLIRPLRIIAPLLGAARDLDVMGRTVAQARGSSDRASPGCRTLRQELDQRRLAARRAARNAVKSESFLRLASEAARWRKGVRAKPLEMLHEPARAFAAAALEQLHDEVLNRVDDAGLDDASDRHRVRIRLKRLRYACEFFAGLHSRRAERGFLAAVKALQDLLGELNDIATARYALEELAGGEPEPGVSNCCRRVVARLLIRERALLACLAKTWSALRCSAVPLPYWRA